MKLSQQPQTRFIFTEIKVTKNRGAHLFATILQSSLMFIRKIDPSRTNMRNEAETPPILSIQRKNWSFKWCCILMVPGTANYAETQNPPWDSILNAETNIAEQEFTRTPYWPTSREVWFFPQNRWLPDNLTTNVLPLVRRAQTLAPHILATALEARPPSPLIFTSKQLFASKQQKQAKP